MTRFPNTNVPPNKITLPSACKRKEPSKGAATQRCDQLTRALLAEHRETGDPGTCWLFRLWAFDWTPLSCFSPSSSAGHLVGIFGTPSWRVFLYFLCLFDVLTFLLRGHQRVTDSSSLQVHRSVAPRTVLVMVWHCHQGHRPWRSGFRSILSQDFFRIVYMPILRKISVTCRVFLCMEVNSVHIYLTTKTA